MDGNTLHRCEMHFDRVEAYREDDEPSKAEFECVCCHDEVEAYEWDWTGLCPTCDPWWEEWRARRDEGVPVDGPASCRCRKGRP